MTPDTQRPDDTQRPYETRSPGTLAEEPPRNTVPHQAPTPLGRLVATVERLRREVREAHAAADGRALVELAKGILIGQLSCTPAAAARQLDELSRETGLSPLELAADIVNQASRDHVSEVAAAFARRTGTPEPAERSTTVSVRLRTAESGVLAAADDTQAVAESLLTNALGPLGADAVAVWSAAPDGSLALAGHAGFPPGEAARWRHVPPGVSTVARLALRERRLVTLARIQHDGPPSIGHLQRPDGGRMAVPAGTGGRIHGVLEICWPQPLAPQPPQIERQVEALAELCARTMDAAPTADPGALDAVLPDVAELIDLSEGLHDPAVVLTPVLDHDGRLTDFRIRHASSRFVDPAGRPRGDVNGARLLEAYPMAGGESGLFDIVERVHATGEPFRAERMSLTALVDQIPLTSVADISVSRHGAAVLLIWRVEDETARLADLLQHAQRLGRIGGFEENLVTGGITWNAQLYALHGLPTTAPPVRLRELPGYAHPDDSAALARFLRAVLRYRPARLRQPAPAQVRRHHPPHPCRRRARPRRRPATPRRPGRLPGHLRSALDRGRPGRDPGPTRPHRGRVRRTQPPRPATPTRDHAAHPAGHRGPRRARRRPLPARRDRIARRRRLVRHRGPALRAGHALRGRRRRTRHRGGHRHGRPAQRAARPRRDRSGPRPAAVLAQHGHPPSRQARDGHRGLRDLRPQHQGDALGAGRAPAPVLVRDGEAEAFPLIEGLLLGALPEVTYAEREVRLEPDDTLLMYTDGLVERRDSSVQDSLGHLMNAAAACAGDLDRQLDRLLAESRSDTDDDTCVIGIRVG